MRVAVPFLGAIFLLSALAVPGVHAAGTPGVLYMTNTVTATDPANPPNGLCPTGENHYDVASTAQATSGKAYLAFNTPNTSPCGVYFEYKAPAPFTIETPLHVSAYVGCEVPSVSSGFTTALRYTFVLNKAGVGGFQDAFDMVACTGPTTLTKVEMDVDPGAPVDVATGDAVGVFIQNFIGTNPPAESPQQNLFFLTGDATQPSTLSNPAFGNIASTVGTESINLAAKPSTAATTPGGFAFYNLTVTNLGSATEITMSALGLPSGYAVAFNPLNAPVASNSTTPVGLRVTAPASATGGTHLAFKAAVRGTAGANKTVDLTLDIVKPATKPGSGTSNGPGGPGSTTGGNNGGDGFTDTNDTNNGGSKKSPGVEFAANLLAVGLLVVAMRRRVA